MPLLDDEGQALFLRSLQEGSDAIGIPTTPEQRDLCLRYATLLLAYNEHTNLTRIVEPSAIAIKHFVDSLSLLLACPDLPHGASVADVGTGAGFPGMALKIVRPDLQITLIDSLGKRLTFLRESIAELGLSDGVTLLHSRAEDAGHDAAQRDRFDLVTARAVAALPTLLEWCGPLTRPGGRFIALKATIAEDELTAGESAASVLGLRLAGSLSIQLPAAVGEEAAERRLLIYQKLRPTPPKFPRRSAEIKARPLGG